jgi:CBS domain-containing protein
LFDAIVPGMVTAPVGFSLAGMAALFAGTWRAPLTSMIIISEISPRHLDSGNVEEVMRTTDTVSDDMPIEKFLEHAVESGQTAFPVLSGARLVGVVAVEDAGKNDDEVSTKKGGRRGNRPVRDIVNRRFGVAFRGETVRAAMERMEEAGANRTVVCDSEEQSRAVGMISAGEVVRAHELGLARNLE